MLKHIPVTRDASRCSTCILNTVCLPLGMSHQETTKLDTLINERIRIPKTGSLFRQGDPVEAIYGLRSGSIKTQIEESNGQTQITGFLLPGEILGLDGFMEELQASHAIALEDTEVCIIRLNELDLLAQHLPSLQKQLRRIMSKEISRAHHRVLTLGSLRSEQRVAAFLLNLSQRMHTLGYSPNTFLLRMSREDIGNFLGLTLETISRLLSRFARQGLIRVHQREIQILDMGRLEDLSGLDCGT